MMDQILNKITLVIDHHWWGRVSEDGWDGSCVSWYAGIGRSKLWLFRII